MWRTISTILWCGTVLVCSTAGLIVYAVSLFQTFRRSDASYRNLAFFPAFGLLALAGIDSLHLGLMVVLALIPISSIFALHPSSGVLEVLFELTSPVVSGLVVNRKFMAVADATLNFVGGVLEPTDEGMAQAYRVCFSFAAKSAFMFALVIAARGLGAVSTRTRRSWLSYFGGPVWKDWLETVTRTVTYCEQGLAAVIFGHGVLVAVILLLAFLPAFVIAIFQLLLIVTAHAVFLGVLFLLAKGCAPLIYLVERAVILARAVIATPAHRSTRAGWSSSAGRSSTRARWSASDNRDARAKWRAWTHRGKRVVTWPRAVIAAPIYLVERAVIFARAGYAKCPHAKCHKPVPLPVFRCGNSKCNEKHTRLVPGRDGVFRRACDGCGTSMPTLFWLGKGRLPSLCPHCGGTMAEELFATNIHVPIYGDPSAGKTMYMMAVAHELMEDSRWRVGDVVTRLIDQRDSNRYESVWRPEFEKGKVLKKTANPYPDAFLLNMRRGRGMPTSVYLYDPAGEAMWKEEDLREHRFLTYSDGVVILIDPLSLESFAKAYTKQNGPNLDSTTSKGSPRETVTRIANMLDKIPRGRKKRVAVVLTKADVKGFEKVFGVEIGDRKLGRNWKAVGKEESSKLAAWFSKEERGSNEKQIFNLLKAKFSEIRFFAVSALGRVPGLEATSFKPVRVAEPFCWLLSRRGAFSHPLRDRIVIRMMELGAAIAVVVPLVLFPGYAFVEWGLPFVSKAIQLSFPVRVETQPASPEPERRLKTEENALNLTPSQWKRVQTNLSNKGFYRGPVDGLPGDLTRSAIRAWQTAQGKLPTGYLNDPALSVLARERDLPAQGGTASHVSEPVSPRTHGKLEAPPAVPPDVEPESRSKPGHSRVRAGITLPVIVDQVPPEYPNVARQAQTEGVVILQALINTEGKIQNLRVVSGHKQLVPAAMRAVRQWRYKPAKRNDEPIKYSINIKVNFVLDRTR